jgi:DNA invertase Pin-like site-specific DNA recombinase
LEAQDGAIAAYAASKGCEVVASYTEVESGRRNDRPELAKALAHARRLKATLVVAKLDRLARNARFLLGIVEGNVDVVFCDYPSLPSGAAGKLVLTQLAAVAEFEATRAGERSREVLAVVKARGGRVGTPANLTTDARQKGARVNQDKAAQAYSLLAPTIAHFRSEGLTLAQIAERLNSQGHTTRNGTPWTAVQVHRVLGRL